MFYCEKCGTGNCCERRDLKGEPVLCDECYGLELFGIDCDLCQHSYYKGDELRCEVEVCKPKYDVN